MIQASWRRQFEHDFFDALADARFEKPVRKDAFGQKFTSRILSEGEVVERITLDIISGRKAANVYVSFFVPSVERLRDKIFAIMSERHGVSGQIQSIVPPSTLVASAGAIFRKENFKCPGFNGQFFVAPSAQTESLRDHYRALTEKIVEYFSFVSDIKSVLRVLLSGDGIYFCPTDIHFVLSLFSACALRHTSLDLARWIDIRPSLRHFSWANLQLEDFATEFMDCSI